MKISRITSFVVSFVFGFNKVNVNAVATRNVVHASVIGHHVPCHHDFMFPRRSYHARLRLRGAWAGGMAALSWKQGGLGGRHIKELKGIQRNFTKPYLTSHEQLVASSTRLICAAHPRTFSLGKFSTLMS